ncbi:MULTISPECIES: MFS transporter [Methylobacterium]|uniref:MFS transporter n=1 Tax=Methylobacterium longum TaxID=767694 RepID=A0ABT8ALQ2_9HYPH|nr:MULTISPECIES: MFS transporter [Methylobacterium]MCJ2099635.1 MFS transporter [Methylobacterium sp. E-046]MDN3570833.1 MFS transporter [Methylobacterium longum]GJE13545.1 Sialic acid transporter NanT [Methylobacterium longum]
MSSGEAVLHEDASAPWYAGLTPRHWRILWGSYLGWIFDGYEAVALVYALRPALNTLLTPEQAQAPAFYVGAAIGITLLGWGLGGLLGGIAADYIGRKRMMMLSILGYAVFTGLTAFAGSFTQLAVLRFITGLAIGSEWSTGIALVAETWPNRARPKGCGFLQSGFGGGAVLAAIVWAVLAATNPMGDQSWRIMFALGALPAFVCLYLRRALEESEQWMQALKEQRWAATTEDAGHAPRAAQRPFTLAEIFREPESRRRVLLATAMSFATTVGWWAVSSWLPAYTEGLARAAGEPADVWGPRMGIIYNLGAITAYVVSGFVADAIGRRAFLLVTYVGCIATSLACYLWTGGLVPFMGLAFLNGFFTLGFAFSWMAIYLVELFTPAVRATAASTVFNGARLIAWIFPIIAGQIVTSFGGVAAAALTMSSVYGIGLVVPWFMPETAGRPLPE